MPKTEDIANAMGFEDLRFKLRHRVEVLTPTALANSRLLHPRFRSVSLTNPTFIYRLVYYGQGRIANGNVLQIGGQDGALCN